MRVIAIAAAMVLAGCAGTPEPPSDPLVVITDREAHVNERTRALQDAENAILAGTLSADALRPELKNLLWDITAPIQLRVAAYQSLLTDQSDENLDDVRRFSALRVPTEPTAELVTEICNAAIQFGWTDITSALIRSYARPAKDTADAERPERAALESLHPDVTIERLAFDVFVDPQVVEGDNADDRRERARADAWSLLARLDSDGIDRLAWIREAEAGPSAQVVQWCALELHTIPITGLELRQLDRMVASRGEPGGWWEQAGQAVDALPEDRRSSLRIRHLEPIRWAAEHRPELLAQSRDELLGVLRSMDASRRHHRRINYASTQGPTRDRLKEWEDELSWADMVMLLVIDDALRRPRTIEMLFGQAQMDQADKTTELGGVLEATDDGFVARLYPPRPRSRLGDRQFIASEDMIVESTFSMAHYHFHVQQDRNVRYAGPSQGDQVYATEHGRNCVILTSIREGVLGIDVVMPNDVTIDLGELRRDS